jgi:hypothetical protein
MTVLPRLVRCAAWASLAFLAAAVTACSSGTPQTQHTVTVIATPSAPTTPSPTVSAQPTASPTQAGPQPCPTSGLSVYLGPSQGATGHIYQVIDFKNASEVTCTLYGYPGVSFATGTPVTQVGFAAREDPSTPRVLVTLAPGAVANALLTYTQAGFYTPPSTCMPVNTTDIQIYPPNQTTPTYIAYSSQICSRRYHELTIGTVHPGSGGAG